MKLLFEALEDSISKAKESEDFTKVDESLSALKERLFDKVILYGDEGKEYHLYPFVTGRLKAGLEKLIKTKPQSDPINKKLLELIANGDIDVTDISDEFKVAKSLMATKEFPIKEVVDRSYKMLEGIYINESSRELDIYYYKFMALIINDKEALLRGILEEKKNEHYKKSLEFWDSQNLEMIREKVNSFRKRIV